METYIFNCYSKWIKDREGSIIKQMSRLTIFARILIVSLVVALVGIIVTYILMYNKIIDQIYLLIFLGVEGLVALITYFYTSRYEVAHSYTSLSQYKGYCKELLQMLKDNEVANSELITDIIERVNKHIEKMDNKISAFGERVHKFMELLVIPIAITILGGLFNGQEDSQIISSNIIMIVMSVIFIYAIVGGIVCLLINLTIKSKQEKYIQFKCDLQSVVDFNRCDRL